MPRSWRSPRWSANAPLVGSVAHVSALMLQAPSMVIGVSVAVPMVMPLTVMS